MAIEINGQTTPHTNNTNDGTAIQITRHQPTKAQQETGSSSTLDTVSITDTAVTLQKLESAIADAPVTDLQRIADIQNAISNGTFEMDATSTAEKILNFESSLFG